MSKESMCFTREIKCYIPVGPKGQSYEILDTWGLARGGGLSWATSPLVQHFGDVRADRTCDKGCINEASRDHLSYVVQIYVFLLDLKFLLQLFLFYMFYRRIL